MSKELYMAAHMELCEKYLEENPGADWFEAYSRTADYAHDRARELFAAMIDAARERLKYGE
jgi:hypothetical protein